MELQILINRCTNRCEIWSMFIIGRAGYKAQRTHNPKN
jgi:hypothetical protein